MTKTNGRKMTVVCIEGWEMEVLDGPRPVQVDIYGDMLEFRGVWLSEPERGVVNVYCRRESVFYIEVTQEEILPRRTGPRNKVTYIRGGGEKDPAGKDSESEDPGEPGPGVSG